MPEIKLKTYSFHILSKPLFTNNRTAALCSRHKNSGAVAERDPLVRSEGQTFPVLH